jgi:hypothetical protein
LTNTQLRNFALTTIVSTRMIFIGPVHLPPAVHASRRDNKVSADTQDR